MKRGMTDDEVDDDVTEFGTRGAPWRSPLIPTRPETPEQAAQRRADWWARPRTQTLAAALTTALRNSGFVP